MALIEGAHREALRLAVRAAEAWAQRRWAGARASLLEGAWRWEPARALRYRLLLRVQGEGRARLRLLELARPLGAVRLVPVRYVTESARVSLVLGVAPDARSLADALAFLQRYESVCLDQDKNTALVMVSRLLFLFLPPTSSGVGPPRAPRLRIERKGI